MKFSHSTIALCVGTALLASASPLPRGDEDTICSVGETGLKCVYPCASAYYDCSDVSEPLIFTEQGQRCLDGEIVSVDYCDGLNHVNYFNSTISDLYDTSEELETTEGDEEDEEDEDDDLDEIEKDFASDLTSDDVEDKRRGLPGGASRCFTVTGNPSTWKCLGRKSGYCISWGKAHSCNVSHSNKKNHIVWIGSEHSCNRNTAGPCTLSIAHAVSKSHTYSVSVTAGFDYNVVKDVLGVSGSVTHGYSWSISKTMTTTDGISARRGQAWKPVIFTQYKDKTSNCKGNYTLRDKDYHYNRQASRERRCEYLNKPFKITGRVRVRGPITGWVCTRGCSSSIDKQLNNM